MQSPNDTINNRASNQITSNRLNNSETLIQYYASNCSPEQTQSPHVTNNQLIQYNHDNDEESSQDHHYMHLHHSLSHVHHHPKRSKIDSDESNILQYQLSKPIPTNPGNHMHQYYELFNNGETNNQQVFQFAVNSSPSSQVHNNSNYMNHLLINDQNLNQNENNNFPFNNIELNNSMPNSVIIF